MHEDDNTWKTGDGSGACSSRILSSPLAKIKHWAGNMAYSTREIGHILGLPPYTVRYYARKGLGRNGQGKGHYYRFSFQELLLFKTVCRLLFHGVSLRRIKKILTKLPDQMPGDNSPTAAAIWTEGEKVFARHGNHTWNPESGQVLMNFGNELVMDKISVLENFRAEEAK